MAVFRLSVTTISRGEKGGGKSSVAAAAYRASECIKDDRTGIVHDFTRKRGVLHSEIAAPANAPDWVHNRAELWRAVETASKRSDARVAREIQLSLPHELTPSQRLDLVRDFVKGELVGRGMIADFSIHEPSSQRGADPRNHHAHILVTTREIGPEGFGPVVRDWNDVAVIETWRKSWADRQNDALERAGHDARVDHRSYEDRGIDQEPEPKMGPTATEMERRGEPSELGDQRREVRSRNRQRNMYAELKAMTLEALAALNLRRAEKDQDDRAVPDATGELEVKRFGLLRGDRPDRSRFASLRERHGPHQDRSREHERERSREKEE